MIFAHTRIGLEWVKSLTSKGLEIGDSNYLINLKVYGQILSDISGKFMILFLVVGKKLVPLKAIIIKQCL